MMVFKQGICPLCPPGRGTVPTVKGLCQSHYWRNLKNKVTRKMLSGKPEEERRELKSWYEHGISISTWVCENCGDAIPNFSEEARYSAQAHLLPKHLFASVKTHPHNRLHLGNRFGCNCHDKYDLSFENAIRMPVMEIAVVRFDKLIPHISSSEVRYLPTLFRQHYELKTIL